MIATICYAFAFVLLFLAAVGIPSTRFSLLAGGLLFWLIGERLERVGL